MTTCYWRHFGPGAVVHEPCVVLRPEMIEIGAGARVDSFAKLEGGLGITIGENCHVSSFVHLNAGGGRVILGAHSGIASHAVICGGATDYTGPATTPQDGATAKRLTTFIGEYALIYAGAIILPGVNIAPWAVIGAGSVVTKDVGIGDIVLGNPARVVGFREVMIRE